MPGGNCCFPQCTVSRYVIHNDRHLFKITTRKAPFYAKWRDDIINIVKQYREIDATFTQKAESGKKYICDRHFLPTDIQTNGEWVYNWFYSVDPFSTRARGDMRSLYFTVRHRRGTNVKLGALWLSCWCVGAGAPPLFYGHTDWYVPCPFQREGRLKFFGPPRKWKGPTKLAPSVGK